MSTTPRVKRPAPLAPPARRPVPPERVPVVSGPCADKNHGRCTGRVYNAARVDGEPRFVACDCTGRTCWHGAEARARHRAAAAALKAS